MLIINVSERVAELKASFKNLIERPAKFESWKSFIERSYKKLSSQVN